MTREEAIDELQDLRNEVYNEDSDGYIYAKAIDMAIEALSAEAVQEWIPVSERLPEHTGDVLVTVGVNRHGLGMYDEIRVATWNTVYRYFYVHEREDVICGEIIAWMPLPEPYKDGDDNKLDRPDWRKEIEEEYEYLHWDIR